MRRCTINEQNGYFKCTQNVTAIEIIYAIVIEIHSLLFSKLNKSELASRQANRRHRIGNVRTVNGMYDIIVVSHEMHCEFCM